jgi:hypothetical protein
MRDVKAFGLAVMIALTVCVGSASATTLTSPAGTPSTGPITMSAETTEIHAGDLKSFLTITCHKSHIEWAVSQHGSGVQAVGAIKKLSFECTQSTTVLQAGSLAVQPTGGGNGTVTWTGLELRMHTSAGPVCTFKTSNTHIGTLTGGSWARLDIESAIIPGSGFLCPANAVWTGSYAVTSPSYLSVD